MKRTISGFIPADQLTLVNSEAEYSHNDPAGALDNLTPFLERVAR